MAIFWYNRQKENKIKFNKTELNKYILKSLLNNQKFKLVFKVYFWKKFLKNFSRFNSISFFRHYCIITKHARSVFKKFKLVRHQCKSWSSKGYLTGMRKSSF
jgi:ribosomal protein S14